MNFEPSSQGQIVATVNGCLGLITLNRPEALNALSLAMIRDITAQLRAWASDDAIQAVALRGAGREGKPPAFCAGGDIRFFHTAVASGDAALAEFFTAEYTLNHLIHGYEKPLLALMDGICMGGGMGLAQGCKLRVVSERSKLAMPETGIGLFPDVGGGYFLSQCPGHAGDWLALTGEVIGASDALELGLADVFVPGEEWASMLEVLSRGEQGCAEHVVATVMEHSAMAPEPVHMPHLDAITEHFGKPDLGAIAASLSASKDDWAAAALKLLLKRSPLMLAVTLEQIRRARSMSLADELRMERDMVHHCFAAGAASETIEGIRALAIDKDHAPRWNPARIQDVTPAMVNAFFAEPWPAAEHPLSGLRGL